MSSRSDKSYYSNKGDESGNNIEATDEDADFFAELTEERINELEREGYAAEIRPIPPDEIARMLADLDDVVSSGNVATPAPVVPVADWLTAVRELARKHGPFAPWQIDQIILALNAPADEASR